MQINRRLTLHNLEKKRDKPCRYFTSSFAEG
jgi:hypothetical protein